MKPVETGANGERLRESGGFSFFHAHLNTGTRGDAVRGSRFLLRTRYKVARDTNRALVARRRLPWLARHARPELEDRSVERRETSRLQAASRGDAGARRGSRRGSPCRDGRTGRLRLQLQARGGCDAFPAHKHVVRARLSMRFDPFKRHRKRQLHLQSPRWFSRGHWTVPPRAARAGNQA